jgi:hypothetical protein
MYPLKLVDTSKFSQSAAHVYDYNRRDDLGTSALGKKKCSFPLKLPVSMFLDLPIRHRFYQAPVTAFHAWYQNFGFASLFTNTAEGKSGAWEYRIIFLDPTSSDLTGDESVKWACTLISTFYKNNFSNQNHDKDRIQYGVNHDASIAVLGLKTSIGATPIASWHNNRNVKVISAITYRQGKGLQSCTALIM